MKQEFTAVIKQHEDINGAYVEVPFNIRQVFGAKRVKVAAEFDGVPYRGSIVSMGGCYLLGLPQQIRKQIGKGFGDSILVTVEKDEAERVVELPEDFKNALETNDTAYRFWETLSYSNKKRYSEWILTAKKAETRTARIEKAVGMLADGLKM